MTEQTNFNKDLTGAEHWQIEDPASTTDMRARRKFGNMLKDATVVRDISIHQKGKDALSLPIFRRVTLSVNDEPENLSVVPPLDGSILDKIFLFRCSPANVGEDRKAIWAKVMAEIPVIRGWLLALPAVPKDQRDNRFGVRAWHHPALMEELSNLSAETRLLQAIDQTLFDDKKEKFQAPEEFKSVELEKLLRESPYGFSVEKLLHFGNACGAYLARLAKTQPERVSKRMKQGHAYWIIKPPAKPPEE
jgi:hypothetical protein